MVTMQPPHNKINDVNFYNLLGCLSNLRLKTESFQAQNFNFLTLALAPSPNPRITIGYSRVITFDMLESENIYGRHRIQYKIDHTVSAVATSPA